MLTRLEDANESFFFSVRTKYVQLIFTIPFYTECRLYGKINLKKIMCNRFLNTHTHAATKRQCI